MNWIQFNWAWGDLRNIMKSNPYLPEKLISNINLFIYYWWISCIHSMWIKCWWLKILTTKHGDWSGFGMTDGKHLSFKLIPFLVSVCHSHSAFIFQTSPYQNLQPSICLINHILSRIISNNSKYWYSSLTSLTQEFKRFHLPTWLRVIVTVRESGKMKETTPVGMAAPFWILEVVSNVVAKKWKITSCRR